MPAIQNSKETIKWLGGVGSTDRGDRVSLNNVAQALVELGEFLIAKAENNLDKNGNRASGKTANSMKLVNLQTNATKMSLDVEIASTYKFLNEGVKGYESGTGKYQFNKPGWGRKKGQKAGSGKVSPMVLAILKWVKNRRIVSKYSAHSSYSDKLKGDKYGATEKKNKQIKALSDAATSQKSLAYAIATNIKKKGIKPTYFFSGKNYSAVESTQKEQKKRFAKAFKLDIIENLKSN
jgi:hypothetical protein